MLSKSPGSGVVDLWFTLIKLTVVAKKQLDDGSWNNNTQQHSLQSILGMVERHGLGHYVRRVTNSKMFDLCNRTCGPNTTEHSRLCAQIMKYSGGAYRPSQVRKAAPSVAVPDRRGVARKRRNDPPTSADRAVGRAGKAGFLAAITVIPCTATSSGKGEIQFDCPSPVG